MTPEQEDQLARETGRAADAERLMNTPLLREALDTLERTIVDQWKASPIRDVEGQQYLRLMQKTMTDIRKYLQDIMATGKMAAIELDRERTLRERATSAVRSLRR